MTSDLFPVSTTINSHDTNNNPEQGLEISKLMGNKDVLPKQKRKKEKSKTHEPKQAPIQNLSVDLVSFLGGLGGWMVERTFLAYWEWYSPAFHSDCSIRTLGSDIIWKKKKIEEGCFFFKSKEFTSTRVCYAITPLSAVVTGKA